MEVTMLRAISTDYVEEYSLIDDAGDDKTIFTLGVLDAFTRAYIDDTHYTRDEIKNIQDTRITDKYIDFVRFGLKGWKNLKDSKGNAIEFTTEDKVFAGLGKRNVVSDSSLNRLDLKWIIELGYKIISLNMVTEQEVKNS